MCSSEEEAKVLQFALRSYVEDSRKLTWCPAPGCEHAVECTADIGAEPLDVTCNCGATFCFTCKEEAHRPVGPSSTTLLGLAQTCRASCGLVAVRPWVDRCQRAFVHCIQQNHMRWFCMMLLPPVGLPFATNFARLETLCVIDSIATAAARRLIARRWLRGSGRTARRART